MFGTIGFARQSFDPRTLGAMLAWYSGEIAGAAGGTWADLSGNARDATLTNGPTFSTTGGGAISFDGVNDYGSASGVTDTLIGSSWTFALWIRPTGSQSTKGIFAIQGTLTSSGPRVLFQRSDSTNVKWYVNGNYRITQAVSDNTFSHLALTYDGTIYRSYLNGVAGSTYTGGALAALGNSLYLGNGFNGYYNGLISDFGVWGSVLSADRISALYQRTRFRHA